MLLGDEARKNYEQFITDANDDLYEQLVDCILIASSCGAKVLDVYRDDDGYGAVERGCGYAYLAIVHISVPQLVDWEALAKRLEREKLMITWQYYEDDGDVIDTVTWINTEE